MVAAIYVHTALLDQHRKIGSTNGVILGAGLYGSLMAHWLYICTFLCMPYLIPLNLVISSYCIFSSFLITSHSTCILFSFLSLCFLSHLILSLLLSLASSSFISS